MTDANPCCPNCGRELPQTARFCTSCGASITDDMDKPKGAKRTGTLVGKAADKVELNPAGASTASAAESSMTLTDWDILPLDPKAPSAATAQTDGGGGLAAALDRFAESAARKESSSAVPGKAGTKDRTKPSSPKKPDKPSKNPSPEAAKETSSGKSSHTASDKPRSEEKEPDKPSETPLSEAAKEASPEKPSELASGKPQVEEKAAENKPSAAQEGAPGGEKAASQPPLASSSQPLNSPSASDSRPGDGAQEGTSASSTGASSTGDSSTGDSSTGDRPSEGAEKVFSSLDAPLGRPSPTEDPLEKGAPQPAEEHKASPASARGKDNQMASINPSVQEKRTIVEEGTVLRGSLESACPVVVHGRIEGDVQAPSLTVSATGTVEGKVRVDTIECDGQLAGEIDAERVELAGAVKNNTVIRAATIQMKLTDKSGKKQIVFGGSEGAANASGGKEPKDAGSKSKPDVSEGATKKGEASPEPSGGGSGKKRDS